MQHMGEIEEVWFGGHGSVSLGHFAWAQPMRATKWARDTNIMLGLWKRSYTRNFCLKRAFMLWLTVAQLFYSTIFYLKHIVDPKWLALSAATTKCRLQGLAMSRKH